MAPEAEATSYGPREYLEKQYPDVLFWKIVKIFTLYGPEQYLEKCRDDRCIVFVFQNVKVNAVYFDTYWSGKTIPQHYQHHIRHYK